MVKDINPNGDSAPISLTVLGEHLFFSADDGVLGRELWKTDGTPEGTVLVKDINEAEGQGTYPNDLTVLGDILFFEANDGIHGSELWKSDGTAEGTVLVKDINEEPGQGSFLYGITTLNGSLFIEVNRGELWRSDGTEAGTVFIKDATPGNVGQSLRDFTTIGGSLYFWASSGGEDEWKLWKSHGTAETTLPTTVVSFEESGPIVPLGSNILFTGATVETGEELWALPMMPEISSGGLVDAASYSPTLAPGSLASLFGTELVGETVAASGLPLTTSLAQAQVEVNGVLAPLLFASPTQINFQVPFETPTGTTVSVTVRLNGQQSLSEPAAVAEFAPALFINSSTGAAIIQRHPDGAIITAENPAKPGDVLILYVTGIGGLNNPPATGAAATDSPLATATTLPTVIVGGVPVAVLFAGLAPGYVGLGQINIRLPGELPPGDTLSIVVQFGASSSQPGTVVPF